MRDSTDAGDKQASIPQAHRPTPRFRYYGAGDRRLKQAEALAAIPSLLASLLDFLVEFKGCDVEIQIQKFTRSAEKLIALAMAEPGGSA
jgi:hypothetical protein